MLLLAQCSYLELYVARWASMWHDRAAIGHRNKHDLHFAENRFYIYTLTFLRPFWTFFFGSMNFLAVWNVRFGRWIFPLSQVERTFLSFFHSFALATGGGTIHFIYSYEFKDEFLGQFRTNCRKPLVSYRPIILIYTLRWNIETCQYKISPNRTNKIKFFAEEQQLTLW